MRGELIRQKLHRGERVYGTHVCSLGNPLAAKMATQLELDFAFICNEHMPIGRAETSMMCMFYAAHGISPVVRIPCAEAHYASMAADGGADGIVVPYVETVEEVKQIVGAVKYRPIKGRFLREILDGTRRAAAKTKAFLNAFNRDSYVIIGVESVEAVEHLDELLGVPGVDGVFLGPHDLTVSMEIPAEYDDPTFVETVEDVIRRCRQAGVGVGLHRQMTHLKAEHLRRFLDAGMNWIVNGSDVVAMRDEMGRQLAELRRMCGDAYQPHGGTGRNVSPCIG